MMPTLQYGQVPANFLPPPVPSAYEQQALFAIVRHAHPADLVHLMKTAINNGASVYTPDLNGDDLYAIAVKANRADSIQTLLAINIPLPNAKRDGTDILMLAASLNLPNVCETLCAQARYVCDARDTQGRSALFHAVLARSVDCVKVLLKYGANASTATSHLAPTTLDKLNNQIGAPDGAPHLREGDHVTAYSVAVIQDDLALIEVLHKAGADPYRGDAPPLLYAALNDSTYMTDFLLKLGVEVTRTLNQDGDALWLGIKNNISMPTLRLLARDYPFQEDDTDIKDIAMHCISHNHVLGLALCVAHGAQIEAFEVSGDSEWSEAAKKSESSMLLDIMVMQGCSQWNSPNAWTEQGGLNKLYTLQRRPEVLASHFIFPSHLTKLKDAFAEDPPAQDWQSVRQTELYVASEIWLSADKSYEDSIASPSENSQEEAANPEDIEAPDQQWLASIPAAKEQQIAAMTAAARQLISTNQAQLRKFVSPALIQGLATLNPTLIVSGNLSSSSSSNLPAGALYNHVQFHIKEYSSLPEPVVDVLAHAWHEASLITQTGELASASPEQLMHCIYLQGLKIISSRLEPLLQSEDSAVMFWLQELKQTLDKQVQPIQAFFSDPSIFLRRLENRNHLRAVDIPKLTHMLQLELVLPHRLCQSIAEAWSQSVQAAAQSGGWKGPADMHKKLAQHLAPLLSDLFLAQPRELHLSNTLTHSLAVWCLQYMESIAGRLSRALPKATVQPHSMQPQLMQPNLIQPIAVRPTLVQPPLVQPPSMQPSLMQPPLHLSSQPPSPSAVLSPSPIAPSIARHPRPPAQLPAAKRARNE
jgi:hypothetical protein